MAFVTAYAVSTGARQLIPEHWIDDPVIGPQFVRDEAPGSGWPKARLIQYATARGIPLNCAASKAQILAAINTHITTTTDPARGEEE